jgi:membrane-associated phospholipid phosphatase
MGRETIWGWRFAQKMDTKVISNYISTTKLIVIFVASAISFTAAAIIWQQKGLDNAIVIQHNFIYENTFLLTFFRFWSRYGMGLIALLYGLLVFLSFKYEELASSRPLFMFMLFAFAFASISGDLLKEVINRARPAVALAGQIANTVNSNSPAFPSGHATKSLALALPYLLAATGKDIKTRALKIIALISALLVSYSRIALQRHYISDILGALGVALFFIPIAYWFVNMFYRKNEVDQAKLDQMSKRLGVVFLLLAVVLCLI